VTIAYDVAGDGPAVLLLHEGVADRRMWHAQVAALAAEFRVVAPDLRGFGETPHASGPFSHVDDLRDVLDELENDEASVVGGSFGGRVALDFALAFPERVSRLVLCPPVLDDWEPSAVVREGWQAEEAAYEAGDLDRATEANLELWVDGPNRGPDAVDPQVRELVRTMQRHAFELPEPDPPPEERRPVTNAAARLGDVRVPTLVVVGGEDVPDFLELADRAAAGIAGARKVVIADAAHVAPLERPEEFNRVLLPFLRGDS
jgi:pimeloyl-ACP methyl ester carboxylesterase